jgi:hypothetical protein
MPFPLLFLLCCGLVPALFAQAEDPSPSLFKPQEETAVQVIRQGMDIEDTALPPDSTAYEFLDLNQHIGANGVSLFFMGVGQRYGVNTGLPKTHTFGAGLSGDVLTGVSFIHLVPILAYWSYSEKIHLGPFVRQAYRDASLSFNAVFMSPRLTSRKFRFYAGGGPSLHLTLFTHYDDLNYSETTPGFKNGLGALAGFELPLSGMVTFVVNTAYKQTYDWSTLYRRFFLFSIGFAV